LLAFAIRDFNFADEITEKRQNEQAFEIFLVFAYFDSNKFHSRI